MKTMNKLIISVTIALTSFITLASDLVSSESVKAKILDVRKDSSLNGDHSYEITLDVKGEVSTYPFSPLIGDFYYKFDYSKAPIEKINHKIFYNVEIGEYKHPDKNETTQKIFYIGKNQFDFGRIE